MESLSKWDLQHWWKLLGAAGALIASASAPAIFVPGVLIGLGLLLFGIGEWNSCQQMPVATPRGGDILIMNVA